MVARPRYTVLMPTHYRSDVIGFAIRSVLAQTEKDFELLVVGDGAEKGTGDVVQSFADERVRWFDLPKGPGYGYANRNIAMAESRGELVAYAADDDVMLPDHLELLGAAFDSPSAKWAYSQALWVSTDGIVGPDLTNLKMDDERALLVRSYNTVSGGSLMIRADAFPTRRWWPEQIAQAADWELMKQLLANYGPAAMRRIAVPTFFHFTAGTKAQRDSHFGLLAGWLALADASPGWPAELRRRQDFHGPLQADYLDRLDSDPSYLKKLRGAVDDSVTRAAMEFLGHRIAPPMASPWWVSREEVASREPSLVSERAELESRLAECSQAMNDLLSSRSWRLLGPARKLAGFLKSRSR